MNNLANVPEEPAKIPLSAVLDGTAINLVSPDLISQMEREREMADVSLRVAIVVPFFGLPVAAGLLYLALTTSPDLLLEYHLLTGLLLAVRLLGVSQQVASDAQIAGWIVGSLLAGLAAWVVVWSFSPFSKHGRRHRVPPLQPLLEQIENTSLVTKKKIERSIGSSPRNIIRSNGSQKWHEIIGIEYRRAISIDLAVITVFFLPINYTKWDIIAGRSHIDFIGTAVLVKFPEDAPNRHLHLEWRITQKDGIFQRRSDNFDEALRSTNPWRRQLLTTLKGSIRLFDSKKSNRRRHRAAFTRSRFVAITEKIPILDQSDPVRTLMFDQELDGFFANLRRLAEAAVALEAAAAIDPASVQESGKPAE